MLRQQRISNPISERLRMAIALRKTTHSLVGKAVGKAQPTVSAWANGDFLPDVDVLERVASCLNVSSVWLITGSGEMKLQPTEASEKQP